MDVPGIKNRCLMQRFFLWLVPWRSLSEPPWYGVPEFLCPLGRYSVFWLVWCWAQVMKPLLSTRSALLKLT